MKRSKEIGNAAPRDDCVITSVVIPAQYASGSCANRAARMESIAATAVHKQWINTGQTGPSVNLAQMAPQVATMLETIQPFLLSISYAESTTSYCQ